MKRIVILALAVLMCIAMLCGCGGDAVSVKYVRENTAQALADSLNYAQVLGLVSESSAKSAQITLKDNFYIPESDVCDYVISFAQDTDCDALSTAFEMTVLGEKIDAKIYVDAQKLTVQSESILGGAYGIEFEEDFDSFVQKLDSSELMKTLQAQGDVKNALENSGIDGLWIENVKAAYEKFEKDMQETDALKSEYFQIIASYCDNISEEKITVNGVERGCVTLEVKLDEQLIGDIIRHTFELRTKSNRARDEFLSAVFPTYSGYRDEQTDFADHIAENLEFSGSLTLYLEKKTGLLVKAKGEADIVPGEHSYNVMLDAYIDNGVFADITVTNENQETVKIDAGITCGQEDGVIVIAPEAEVVADGVTYCLEAELRLDKNDKTYSYDAVDADGNKYALSGRFESTEELLRITMDSITQHGVSADADVEITLETNVQVSAPDEYKNILTMTKEDTYILIGHVTNFMRRMERNAERVKD